MMNSEEGFDSYDGPLRFMKVELYKGDYLLKKGAEAMDFKFFEYINPQILE